MITSGERFLIALVADARYAFRLSEIAEVTESYKTFPFPKAPPAYLGLVNFHGTPVPLLDFAARFRQTPSRQNGVALVLDHKIASLAIRVDGIERIVTDVRIMAAEEAGTPLIDRMLLAGLDTIPIPNLALLVNALEDELRSGPGAGDQRRPN